VDKRRGVMCVKSRRRRAIVIIILYSRPGGDEEIVRIADVYRMIFLIISPDRRRLGYQVYTRVSRPIVRDPKLDREIFLMGRGCS